MLSSYRSLLAFPGAVRFSASAFVARFPIAMLGLGVVFLVESRTGSYSTAGMMSAVLLVSSSLAAPVQARLADRLGQSTVLVPLLVVHPAAVVSFVLLVDREVAVPLVAGAAATSGASLPQVGAFVRRRWVHVLPDRATVQTAYALESVLDEIIFIGGPVVVTLLAVRVDESAAVLCTLAFTVIGGIGYATCRSTEPPRAARGSRPSAARMPWLRLLLVITAAGFLGVTFGSIELSTVAFTDEVGQPAAAGAVLAAFAAGSLLAGIVAGSRAWRTPTALRHAAGFALLATALVPTLVVAAPIQLLVAMFVAGLAVAPTLIAGYSLVQEIVPGSRLTEGLALFGTALGLGVAAGAALTGAVVDQGPATNGFGVAIVASGLAAGVAALVLLPRPAREHAR